MNIQKTHFPIQNEKGDLWADSYILRIDTSYKIIAWAYVWGYFIWHSFGRTTYIRRIPNVDYDYLFELNKKEYSGYTRFLVARNTFGSFKWIKPTTQYEEVYGLAGEKNENI